MKLVSVTFHTDQLDFMTMQLNKQEKKKKKKGMNQYSTDCSFFSIRLFRI